MNTHTHSSWKQKYEFSVSTKRIITLAMMLLVCSGKEFVAQTRSGLADMSDGEYRGCQNLLVNGSFESGLSNWNPKSLAPNSSIELGGERGKSFVKISNRNEKAWNSLSQEIRSKLQVGKTYLVRLRYKTEGDINVGVRFSDHSSVMHSSAISDSYGWNHLIKGDKSWREDTLEFVASVSKPSADEPVFTIYVDYDSPGEILIDNVMVAEVKPSCKAAQRALQVAQRSMGDPQQVTSINASAEEENIRFWETLFSKCGDSYYGDVAPGPGQMRIVTFSVQSQALTEVDKENGYEWRGKGFMRYQRRRLLSFGRWGDWFSPDGDYLPRGQLVAILSKKKGVWSAVYSPFDRQIVANRPTCERIAQIPEPK